MILLVLLISLVLHPTTSPFGGNLYVNASDNLLNNYGITNFNQTNFINPANKLNIRGFYGPDVSIRVDGVKLNYFSLPFNPRFNILPSYISNISVDKSTMNNDYQGIYTGGVIDFSFIDINDGITLGENKVGADFSFLYDKDYDEYDYNMLTYARSEKFNVVLGVSYSDNALMPNYLNPSQINSNNYSSYVNMSYKQKSNVEIKFTSYNLKGKSDGGIAQDNDPNTDNNIFTQNFTNNILNLSFNYSDPDDERIGYFSQIYYVHTVFSDALHNISEFNSSRFLENTVGYLAKRTGKAELLSDQYISYGFNMSKDNYDNFNNTDTFVRGYDATYGIFADDEVNIANLNKLFLTMSLRYDWNSLNNLDKNSSKDKANYLTEKVELDYIPVTGVSVFSNFYNTYNPTKVYERYFNYSYELSGITYNYNGNENLKTEQVQTEELGIDLKYDKWKYAKSIGFTGTYFFTNSRNYVDNTYTKTPDNTIDIGLTNVDRVHINGVDLKLDYQIYKFDFITTYYVASGKDTNTGEYINNNYQPLLMFNTLYNVTSNLSVSFIVKGYDKLDKINLDNVLYNGGDHLSGYTTYDFYMQYVFKGRIKVNIGISNIFNNFSNTPYSDAYQTNDGRSYYANFIMKL